LGGASTPNPSPEPQASEAQRKGLSSLALPLALSSFLYGMSYLAFSVASELRYHLWTTLAALLAAVLVAASPRPAGKARLVLACLPVVAAVVACIWLRQ
jgi:hypothetical protein